jgi:hypothetical protein
MQSLRLRASLHAFVVQASMALAGAVAGGEEIGFEVVEAGSRGARPGLYCYEPLTGEFVERHWPGLLELPGAHEAQMALAARGGLEQYLDTYADEHRGGAPILQDALRCFTRRVFDGADDGFELIPDRFESAYRELEGGTGGEGELAVLALLRGIGLHSAEMALSEGVMLAPLGELDVLPPDPAWRRPDGPASVVALVPGRDPGSIEEALGCLRDLQTALRLYAPGISLSPLAWIRAQGSVWRALPIPGGGRSDGGIVVAPAQEDELRAFASLVTRRRPTEGELAWALERFELGLERDDPLSGLTDHLLALRALLEPEGSRSGRLAGRIAALCAQPQDRIAATERVAHAISLEQSLIAGVNVGADALALAAEIEQNLRALLRDVICGHLAPELVALADSLLVEHREPAPAATPVEADSQLNWFDELDAADDYCATEGEPTVLAPGLRSR